MTHPYPAAQTQIIFTQGTEFEIGQQHAEQLGQFVHQGMAPFYYGFFKRVFSPPVVSPIEKMGLSFLETAIDKMLVRRLIGQIPHHIKERISGVASASGLNQEILLTSLILPDLLPMLQAHWIRLRPQFGIPVAAPPKFGCSSFVAKGSRFLQGRNLDFPGVAYWDRYPVIQVTHPKKGLKFIAITSAGVPLAGISGINEAGISVALHQHYALETNWSGRLPFVISERILNEATCLEDALRILKSDSLASSWAFVVADGAQKNAFIYEASPRRAGIRWLEEEGNVLAHSNYFQSEACRNLDYATTERMNWDNFFRKNTLEQKIRGSLVDLTVEHAVRCMSDHWDGFWGEEKTVNRTVSQVYNIQSYVIDLSAMKLYLAEGDCPIQLRGYREYDLTKLFNFSDGSSHRVVPGFQFAHPKKKLAKESYILSFIAAFDGKYELAFERLQKSLTEEFVPEAALVAALVNLRCEGELQDSINLLEKAELEIDRKLKNIDTKQVPPEYFEILLYQARTFDLKGERKKALDIYQRIAHHPCLRDLNIARLARKAKNYHFGKVKRMIMPYSTYIPFE